MLENLSQRILEPHLIDIREMEVLPRRKESAISLEGLPD